jgi:hypothetical protein
VDWGSIRVCLAPASRRRGLNEKAEQAADERDACERYDCIGSIETAGEEFLADKGCHARAHFRARLCQDAREPAQ